MSSAAYEQAAAAFRTAKEREDAALKQREAAESAVEAAEAELRGEVLKRERGQKHDAAGARKRLTASRESLEDLDMTLVAVGRIVRDEAAKLRAARRSLHTIGVETCRRRADMERDLVIAAAAELARAQARWFQYALLADQLSGGREPIPYSSPLHQRHEGAIESAFAAAGIDLDFSAVAGLRRLTLAEVVDGVKFDEAVDEEADDLELEERFTDTDQPNPPAAAE